MSDFFTRKKVEFLVIQRIDAARRKVAAKEKYIKELEDDLEYSRAVAGDLNDEIKALEGWLEKYGAGPNMESEEGDEA